MQDITKSQLPSLAPRDADSHKGNYGRVLIIGGSRGMAGAPALAGRAALRSGAGLVTLAVPRSIQATVAGYEPSYMTLGLGGEADDHHLMECQAQVVESAKGMTGIALGPGLGTDDSTCQLVCELYQTLSQPMIVDADALNALAQSPGSLSHPGGPRILTPHPGEFQRLTGQAIDHEPAQRAQQAVSLCHRDTSGQTIVVLKGHQTIITDGQQFAVNATGNPGMATGGTGDCLTGVITALVAQGIKPFAAARLGAHVHGLAGDLAAEQLGQVSLIASDLVDFLPIAFEDLPTEF